MRRVTVVLKTNDGGLWILPQIDALQQRGAVITVVLPRGNGRLRAALDTKGIRVVDSPFSFSFRPRPALLVGLWRLRKVLRSTDPDVVFYHLYASALASRLTSLGLAARRVHMVAGPLYLESAGIRLAERLLCRLDDVVIAGSQHTAELYRSIGMPAERISVVPYGVDTAHFCRGPDRRVELFACSPSTFVVIMVAYVYAPKGAVYRRSGIKGHDVLLRAWKDFVPAHPESLLVFVGSGFDEAGEEYRQKLLRAYDVSSDPTVRWFASVDDVRPFYSSVDLSVSPSLSDNHGAALEASAMSLPSVVSDAGALPEAVTAASGIVVRRNDGTDLLRGLKDARAAFDAGRLTTMGHAARQLCQRRFAHTLLMPRIADLIGGGSPAGGILAFTEQRGWRHGDCFVVRKTLPIVELMASKTDVRLALRVEPGERTGVAPAGSAQVVPLDIGPGRSCFARMVRGTRQIWTLVSQVRAAAVVYADQPGTIGSVGLLLGRLLGKPLVVNVVGDGNESVRPAVIPGVKGRVAHVALPRLQRWTCAHATYINYVTSTVLQLRYPARRARESFACSTVRALGPPRPRRRPRGAVRVVTVGSLERNYKGIDDLVDAVALCRQRGVEVSLTVIGDGKLRSHLERRAADVLHEGVVFTGHLREQDLYRELGTHDLFALASWTEGLPRALVEAMADGMPAVATGVGGVPELLESCRVVPARDPARFAEALLVLLADDDCWQRSVAHNLRVSAELLRRGPGIRDDFVARVVDLSRQPAVGRP